MDHHGSFVGEHRIDPHGLWLAALGHIGKTMIPPQAAPDLVEQRIFAAESQIRNPDASWVAATTGRTAADCENFPTTGLSQQQGLVRGGVDCIDDPIHGFFEKFGDGAAGEKARHDVNLDVWIDGLGALRHHLSFLATDMVVRGMQLAVDVADANFIEVAQRDFADA